MGALQNQYWAHYKFYQQYKEQFLPKDIQAWEIRNKYKFNFTACDLEDIKSELKCLLLTDIRSKYLAGIHIIHPRNYVLAVCKNDLQNTLIKILRLRKNKSRYEREWKVKMVDAKNRKSNDLLIYLDQYSYAEVRELFMSALNIREMVVVYLVHCRFSYTKIAEILKISVDYCRKIYNQAEHKLTETLDLA